MQKVKIYHRKPKSTTDYYVFTSVQEFEDFFMGEDGVVPKLNDDWRTGQEGEWVLADDGGVTQIIKRNKMGKGKYVIDYVVTPVGSFNCNYRKTGMDTDLSWRFYPSDRYRLIRKPQSWKDKRRTRKGLSKAEKKWVRRVKKNLWQEDPIVSYMEIMNSQRLDAARRKVDLLLKQPRIIEAIMGYSIEDAAKNMHITHDYILKEYKKIIDNEDSTPDTKIKALKELGGIIGTYKVRDESKEPPPDSYIPGRRSPQLVSYSSVDEDDGLDLEEEEKLLASG